MELYKEILCHILADTRIEISFPNMESPSDLFRDVCYRTLKKIKSVLEDETLNDPECFEKIEQIMEIFEDIGCRISGRHDFG